MFKKINVYFEMWDFGSEKLHIATARFSLVFFIAILGGKRYKGYWLMI